MQSIVSSYHLCLAPPPSVLRHHLLCHRVPPIRLPSRRSPTSLRLFPCGRPHHFLFPFFVLLPLDHNRYFAGWGAITSFITYLWSVFASESLFRWCAPILLAAVSRESEMAAAAKEDGQDPRIPKIASSIRVIPDFPKPGIMFQDITTLLLDTEAFKDTIDIFVERYKGKGISVVAGVEARGFIFGPPIALAIGAKFVPMRKPKKLPGKVISEEYSLEYGTDKIEMHVGAVEPGERAIIIDDLIATGGTLAAAIRLLERVGVKIVECACVIELPELNGREKLGEAPLFILVTSDAA
ncbi:hypothetical protein F2Q68_00005657 [Brassica cretica]|uniref:adenine phosphoribosyltransferase n=2 Tax=Brassica cretica TaxID=69181 RepID=A0A8S9JFG6_BRACR|nr:hypothetical protein F2Q68_00005657 [Brassica cretica]KAF3547730.1 hypothetical protein DY000_02008713 [Brassica cretica]